MELITHIVGVELLGSSCAFGAKKITSDNYYYYYYYYLYHY